jgi:hypothetical protein
MADRVYGALRAVVEDLGGSMIYERHGHRYGAWVIKIGERGLTVEGRGDRSFPEIDSLHLPRAPNPKDWDDYSDDLVPDAEDKLMAMLKDLVGGLPPAPEDTQVLADLIERTKWKFSWTLARIYPHEYTTKALCSSDDHAKLIDAIDRLGVSERFGKSHRKYLYFDERKYWHMGDPSSEDPEEWPNVINRAWVDVRRHAANVSHVWTPEEVELQMRLWEIQLEKSTDRSE